MSETIKAKNLNYTHLGRDITVISNVNTVSLSGELVEFTMWKVGLATFIEAKIILRSLTAVTVQIPAETTIIVSEDVWKNNEQDQMRSASDWTHGVSSRSTKPDWDNWLRTVVSVVE